jgi:hypothetical protein
MTEGPSSGWQADVLAALPQPRIEVRANTWPDAYDVIKTAAYNRRIPVKEFIGRAALAIAVFDSNGDIVWKDITRNEPPMHDLRRHNLPPKRKFGHDFGPWEIVGMT